MSTFYQNDLGVSVELKPAVRSLIFAIALTLLSRAPLTVLQSKHNRRRNANGPPSCGCAEVVPISTLPVCIAHF